MRKAIYNDNNSVGESITKIFDMQIGVKNNDEITMNVNGKLGVSSCYMGNFIQNKLLVYRSRYYGRIRLLRISGFSN